MGKREYSGCHICGRVGKLSKDHVPPQKAFNDYKSYLYSGIKAISADQVPWDFTGLKGDQHQNGIGFYSLCRDCNSNTGGWYGRAFVDFIYKGYCATHNTHETSGAWIKVPFHEVYPLRIAKQILTMFFSINSALLAQVHPELTALVLSKEKRGISTRDFGIYIYLLRGSITRYIGIASLYSTCGNQVRLVSELSAPPFGFVLEIKPKSVAGQCNIADFLNNYYYRDKTSITLVMPILECNTWCPLDYRTKQQVLEAYLHSKRAMQSRNAGTI